MRTQPITDNRFDPERRTYFVRRQIRQNTVDTACHVSSAVMFKEIYLISGMNLQEGYFTKNQGAKNPLTSKIRTYIWDDLTTGMSCI